MDCHKLIVLSNGIGNALPIKKQTTGQDTLSSAWTMDIHLIVFYGFCIFIFINIDF